MSTFFLSPPVRPRAPPCPLRFLFPLVPLRERGGAWRRTIIPASQESRGERRLAELLYFGPNI